MLSILEGGIVNHTALTLNLSGSCSTQNEANSKGQLRNGAPDYPVCKASDYTVDCKPSSPSDLGGGSGDSGISTSGVLPNGASSPFTFLESAGSDRFSPESNGHTSQNGPDPKKEDNGELPFTLGDDRTPSESNGHTSQNGPDPKKGDIAFNGMISYEPQTTSHSDPEVTNTQTTRYGTFVSLQRASGSSSGVTGKQNLFGKPLRERRSLYLLCAVTQEYSDEESSPLLQGTTLQGTTLQGITSDLNSGVRDSQETSYENISLNGIRTPLTPDSDPEVTSTQRSYLSKIIQKIQAVGLPNSLSGATLTAMHAAWFLVNIVPLYYSITANEDISTTEQMKNISYAGLALMGALGDFSMSGLSINIWENYLGEGLSIANKLIFLLLGSFMFTSLEVVGVNSFETVMAGGHASRDYALPYAMLEALVLGTNVLFLTSAVGDIGRRMQAQRRSDQSKLPPIVAHGVASVVSLTLAYGVGFPLLSVHGQSAQVMHFFTEVLGLTNVQTEWTLMAIHAWRILGVAAFSHKVFSKYILSIILVLLGRGSEVLPGMRADASKMVQLFYLLVYGEGDQGRNRRDNPSNPCGGNMGSTIASMLALLMAAGCVAGDVKKMHFLEPKAKVFESKKSMIELIARSIYFFSLTNEIKDGFCRALERHLQMLLVPCNLCLNSSNPKSENNNPGRMERGVDGEGGNNASGTDATYSMIDENSPLLRGNESAHTDLDMKFSGGMVL